MLGQLYRQTRLWLDGTTTTPKVNVIAQPGVDIGDVTVNNAAGASAVNIQDGGNSVTVDGTFWQATQPVSAASLPLPTGAATAALQLPDSHNVTIDNAAGAAAVNIQDGGNAITVDGTVTAAAQPGVDIGDVTINNAAGAAAVNIQDGGNAITVDGTVTAAAQPGVDIGDVTINNAAGASAVNVQDGGNALTVDAVDLDIRNLVAATDKVDAGLWLGSAAPTVGQKLMASSIPVVVASDQSNVNVAVATELPAGTQTIGQITTNIQQADSWPGTHLTKTLLFATISQAGAGTTALVAADTDELYYVVSYVLTMDVAGTVKFTDGTADLTGAMNVAANGGFVAVGTPQSPLFKTAAINRALNIVTTGGGADGHISYFKATS